MFWLGNELKNPLSGVKLKYDSPHSLTDGAMRFPVIENIPYLRANRDELRAQVLERLDAGDERGALVLLLQDRDDWATGDAPTLNDLQTLFDTEDLTLRAAMRGLQYGAVADYFAYRWSDPTFLSGLCLLENHLPVTTKNVFELCCGIGHFLREFDLRGIAAAGADVVYSKLWVARKLIAPQAKLVCFDANYAFPFDDNAFDAAFCHDAFYFLPKKTCVARELKRTSEDIILVGHAHNREAENFSSGAAILTAEYTAMFEDPVVYDDAELTTALIENRMPKAQAIGKLKKAEAISLATSERNRDCSIRFSLPPIRKSLRINPLLGTGDFKVVNVPNYPSERYGKEYAPLSAYLNLSDEDISFFVQEAMFYGHWEHDKKLIDLVRRRIFLDLPERW